MKSFNKFAPLRSLSIYLDVMFLEAWRGTNETFNYQYAANESYNGPPIFLPFARLLFVLQDSLASLSFKISESTGLASPWRRFPYIQVSLSFNPWLQLALSIQFRSNTITPVSFALGNLTKLHIDGFHDLAPLLKLCPNLRHLAVCNSGGYDAASTTRLVQNLELYTPHLTYLSLTPETLVLDQPPSPEPPKELEPPLPLESKTSSTELIQAIGNALPYIEQLFLQTRWFGYGTSFVSINADPDVRMRFILSSLSYMTCSLLCTVNLETQTPGFARIYITPPTHTHTPPPPNKPFHIA